MAICERCTTESPSGFRFCGACGAPLAPDALDRDARKVVTALFCDIADSTALGEQLDPEALHRVLGRFFDSARASIERHGGTVQKYAGDAVLAVFGIPQVHEDDALRAVRVAAEIAAQLPELEPEVGIPLRVRMGVNTGVVLTDEGRNLALGDAVNVAARLQQAAAPGEILIGAETLPLIRDAVEVDSLEPLTLRGKAEPVQAYRLVRLDPTAAGLARRLDVRLVNRVRELALLRGAWKRAVDERGCELVTLLGAAGVGKSRLAEELVSELGSAARVLRGRCLPYGEGITFWPIIEALTPVGAAAAPILEHVSSGGVATREELFLEVRRLLESLAAQQPLILYIDDLHWAEPMLIELLEHVTALSGGAPLLLLCTARPELLEEHARWGASTGNVTTIRLETLGDAECAQLLDELGHQLDPDARVRVIRTSEGNPLFLQEMVVLAREPGGVEVPPTIQALLAARLERLHPDERELLARSAIEGEVFHRSAVLELAGEGSPTELESLLEALVRQDLIRPHPADVPGDRAWRFRHLLIRDAAYERLPKATRAELHARYANWLEHAAVDFAEVDELAGWHLEQSVRNDREIRRRVDIAIAERAARHLLAAGRRAGDRSDVAAARNLLERALSLAPDGAELRADVSLALAERMIEAGELTRADELLSLAERDRADLGTESFSRLEWLVYARPDEATHVIESLLPRKLAELAAAGDERGLARAHWLAFWVHWARSRATRAAEEVRLSAEHARRGGDSGLSSRALGWYVATLMYGPQHTATMATELGSIAQQDPGPYLRACVDLGWSEVRRLDGGFDDARSLAQSALEGFRVLGIPTMSAVCDQSLAAIELSAGDPRAALEVLQRSEAILSEYGERGVRSTTQAMLACVHLLLGDAAAAASAVELAEALSAPQDLLNFVYTYGVRAQLALAGGERGEAERCAREAVAYASRTDFVGLQGDAHFGLAQTLFELGHGADAADSAREALRLFDLKGNLPAAAAVRELLAEQELPARSPTSE